MLDPSEKLFVVHVYSGKKDRWDSGGPLLPNMSTALAHYPHKIVELDKDDSVHSTLLDFVERNAIDVLILGSRENKGAVQKIMPGAKNLGSTSDNVKSRAKTPVLIIRPASARNEKMRIKSLVNVAAVMDSSQASSGLPPHLKASLLQAQRPPIPRRVAVAFDSSQTGRNMLAWAHQLCLLPDDELFLVQCIARGHGRQMSRRGSLQLQPAETMSPEELDTLMPDSRFTVSTAQLRGDIKSELVDFAEEHAVDLLVVAASSNVGLKKAFGTSTSTHLTHHAPCPTLVVPTRIANPGAELHTTSENFDRASSMMQRAVSGSDGGEDDEEVAELKSRSSNRGHTAGSPTSSSQDDSDDGIIRSSRHAPARPQEQSLSARSSIESVKDLEFARMRQQINDKDIKIDALQAQVRQLQQQLAASHVRDPLRPAVSFAT